MNKNQEETHSSDHETTSLPSQETENPPNTATRRELIERYGKYAIVAAPLLLFASKARAIHSRP